MKLFACCCSRQWGQLVTTFTFISYSVQHPKKKRPVPPQSSQTLFSNNERFSKRGACPPRPSLEGTRTPGEGRMLVSPALIGLLRNGQGKCLFYLFGTRGDKKFFSEVLLFLPLSFAASDAVGCCNSDGLLPQTFICVLFV